MADLKFAIVTCSDTRSIEEDTAGAALDEAQKRGMKIWIYDENSYPSGFGGGLVPDSMPESRGLGLDVLLLDDLVDSSGDWALGDSVVYVVEMRKNGDCIDRTKEILV